MVEVKAEAHTDDYVIQVDFDAKGYLSFAQPEDLVKLALCGWGGDYPADEVARHEALSFENEDMNILFGYLRLKRHGLGYECHVDEETAMTWLLEHRPEVAALIAMAIEIRS